MSLYTENPFLSSLARSAAQSHPEVPSDENVKQADSEISPDSKSKLWRQLSGHEHVEINTVVPYQRLSATKLSHML